MECLANITLALREAVSPHVKVLLDPLFANGLSPEVNNQINQSISQEYFGPFS